MHPPSSTASYQCTFLFAHNCKPLVQVSKPVDSAGASSQKKKNIHNFRRILPINFDGKTPETKTLTSVSLYFEPCGVRRLSGPSRPRHSPYCPTQKPLIIYERAGIFVTRTSVDFPLSPFLSTTCPERASQARRKRCSEGPCMCGLQTANAVNVSFLTLDVSTSAPPLPPENYIYTALPTPQFFSHLSTTSHGFLIQQRRPKLQS